MDIADFDSERIQFLIDAGEDDKTEFKQFIDLSKKNKHARAEFVRDIIALANSHGSRPAFLIIGVVCESREVVGIKDGLYDDAEFQNILEAFVAKPLDAQYKQIQLREAIVGVLGARPSGLRPYQVKRDYSDGSTKLLTQGEAWIRAGSKKRRLTPYDTELYFNEYSDQERLRAELVVSWTLEDDPLHPTVRDSKRIEIVLTLENRGNGIAHYPAIDVIAPRELSVDPYGVDGNMNQGLTQRPLRQSRGSQKRFLFAAGAETVIHPNAELDAARFKYTIHEPESAEAIRFTVKVYCDGYQHDQLVEIDASEFRPVVGLTC